MKIELNDEERDKIAKEVAKMIYAYLHENITIRSVISQEIKRYFEEEKKAKQNEEKEIREQTRRKEMQ